MALQLFEQAQELINRSQRILIATREHPSIDDAAAALACLAFFKKLDKTANVYLPGADLSRLPDFLPFREVARTEPGAMRSLHITLDAKETGLQELLYAVHEGKLEIVVTPKRGEWKQNQAQVSAGEDRYDLVLAIGAPDRQSLGALAREHADFLFRTPVINIDHHADNENWGQVNLLDLTAVSMSEAAYNWLDRWNQQLIDEPIATALLGGMMAATKSFRAPGVTPRTLAAASRLMTLGAKRDEVTQQLWRTRNIGTLKLWGRILSRLQFERATGLVWAAATRNDLIETGVPAEQIGEVIDELIAYAPEASVCALLIEGDDGKHVDLIIHAAASQDADRIARLFQGHGSRERATATMPIATTFAEAAREAIARVRTGLKQ